MPSPSSAHSISSQPSLRFSKIQPLRRCLVGFIIDEREHVRNPFNFIIISMFTTTFIIIIWITTNPIGHDDQDVTSLKTARTTRIMSVNATAVGLDTTSKRDQDQVRKILSSITTFVGGRRRRRRRSNEDDGGAEGAAANRRGVRAEVTMGRVKLIAGAGRVAQEQEEAQTTRGVTTAEMKRIDIEDERESDEMRFVGKSLFYYYRLMKNCPSRSYDRAAASTSFPSLLPTDSLKRR